MFALASALALALTPMHLGRRALLTSVPAGLLFGGGRQALAAAEGPRELRSVGGGKLQADDKSFDLTLSDAWTSPIVDSDGALIHATARRKAGGASLEVSCLLGRYGKQLPGLGTPEAAARSLVLPPAATLISAEKVAGRVRGSAYYIARYTVGGREGIAKLSVQQDRLYRLVVEVDKLDADAEAVVDSFQCFPINFICMGQSNGGQVPVSGSCY